MSDNRKELDKQLDLERMPKYYRLETRWEYLKRMIRNTWRELFGR